MSRNFHVRQAAVSALRAWAKGHDYAETLVERHAQRRKLSSPDRALLQAILLGVLRHRRLIDFWIGQLRDGKLDPDTRDRRLYAFLARRGYDSDDIRAVLAKLQAEHDADNSA